MEKDKRGMPLQVDVALLPKTKTCLKPHSSPSLCHQSGDTSKIRRIIYLHDKNGGVHYATTYEGHKANINKYLSRFL